VLSRLPEWSTTVICRASEDEEQIRKAVQMTHRLWVGVVDAEDVPLGSPAHSPADVIMRKS